MPIQQSAQEMAVTKLLKPMLDVKQQPSTNDSGKCARSIANEVHPIYLLERSPIG